MAYTPDQNLQKMRNQFFKSRRDEANQGVNAQQQQGEDAIQRRFTAMGAANSGAAIAAAQKNREAGDQARRNALQDVANQELQIQEQDAGRGFQSQEADVARQFQGGLADKDMAFKRSLADTEQGNKLKEIDLAERQFALDKDTTEFNKRMAEIEANRPQDKGMLGGVGDLFKNPGDAIGNMAKNPLGLQGFISGSGGSGGLLSGVVGGSVAGTVGKSLGIGGGK